MPHPLVVNVRRTKKFDIYGGRPCYGYPDNGWGNPFKTGRDGTRDEVIAKHRKMVLSDPLLIQLIRDTLPGKTIACWCADDKGTTCHCDILAQVANATEEELSILIKNA